MWMMREQWEMMRRVLSESSQREAAQAARLAALEAEVRDVRAASTSVAARAPRDPHRQNIRVRAEVEWPTYDGTDVYYDIDDFLRDLRRVMMLASGGVGYPPQERLEMLRGGLRGMPLLDFKTYVDDSEARTGILESGTQPERESLWEEVESYIRKQHHRPLLERQRRARAEYQVCSMRDGGFVDYPSFQAEFRKCVKNLERAKLSKPAEELKVDFLEKLPEECATHLMLSPWRDEATGETHMIRTVEEAQSMARDFFAIKTTQRSVFAQEEEAFFVRAGKGLKGQAKGQGKGGAKGKGDQRDGGACRCRTCDGVGHLAAFCPSKGAKKNGASPGGLCSICGGRDHRAFDHGRGASHVCEVEAEPQLAQQPKGATAKGSGKGICFLGVTEGLVLEGRVAGSATARRRSRRQHSTRVRSVRLPSVQSWRLPTTG